MALGIYLFYTLLGWVDRTFLIYFLFGKQSFPGMGRAKRKGPIIHLSMEEVAVRADLTLDYITLIVGNRQEILDQQLRPCSIH